MAAQLRAVPSQDNACPVLVHDSATAGLPKVAVVVASVGRSFEINQLLRHLARQSLPPSAIVLSVAARSDLPPGLPPNVDVVMGPKGLTVQRNRGLEKVLGGCDVVVFFDDDFVPEDHSLRRLAQLFQDNPEIVGATGLVVRDGVKQGGLPYSEAVAALAAHGAGGPLPVEIEPTDELYGCNMAFRTAAIGTLRFDETLPLYGWQEDVDFTGQLGPRGRIVKTTAFAGVHRGVAKGRTPGLALGFSQMVNPVYLVRKGTMRPGKAMRLMAKNLIANHAKLVRPEPFIDRLGRSKGNWLGLLAVLRGKSDPRAALRLI